MPAASPQACTANFAAALIGRDMATALTLLADEVVFFYSNGSAIVGKDAFSSLMTESWKMVEDYEYSTADAAWVVQSPTAAAVIYSFTWAGKVRGQPIGGGGRATRVLRNDGSGWLITHEHLSPGEWKPLANG